MNRWSLGRGGLLLLVLVVFAAISSCSARREAGDASRLWIGQAITEEAGFGEGASGGENPLLSGKVDISLAEGLNRAWSRDFQLRKMELAVAQAMISKEKAESGLYPKVDIRADVEWPTSGQTTAQDSLFGGVYFRYNFKDALFAGDGATVAELAAHSMAMNMQARKTRVCYDLRQKAARLDYLREGLRLCGEKAKAVAQAGEYATTLRAIGGEGAGQPAMGRAEEIGARIECQLMERETRQVNGDLRQLIGVVGQEDVTIAAARIAPTHRPGPMDINRAILEAWKSRPEVAALMDQLMAAEINSRTTWRDNIPSFDISLGLGSIILQKERQEESVVVGLGLSFPLFDSGASARDQRRANIAREEKRLEARELARNMAHGIRQAADNLEAAAENVQGQEELVRLLEDRRRELELLSAAGRGNDENNMQTAITHINARMALVQARFTLDAAILGWQEAIGDSCQEP